MKPFRASHSTSHSTSLSVYASALRIRQWTKNLIVFAGPLFAFNFKAAVWLDSFLAFVLFCGLSSSVYLFNDLLDVEADRQHPVKCKRPIAAGTLSVPAAIALALLLFLGTLALGMLKTLALGLTLLGYAVLQIAYNLRLKRTVILDIIAIATGFVLRAYAGAAATGIVLSPWLILCTAMLALFLGVEKRKAELRLLQLKGGKTRSVLKRYSQPLLSRMENVVTTSTIMTYALWSSGPQLNGASTPWMLLTLPFVLYGIFRYQLLSDGKEIARRASQEGDLSERPEEVLLTDRPLLINLLGWLLCVCTIQLLKLKNTIV